MDSTEEIVTNGKVVSIEYVLTDLEGTERDRSREGSPLVYLHGSHNIVPGLEEALVGKTVGDNVKVQVPPEKGYGPRGKAKTIRVLRSRFPADAQIEAGARFMMQDEKGRPFAIWVTKVQGREVHVSGQHPLAGEVLCFDATIVAVRDATDEEKAHGHAHGPGGAH